MTQQPSAILLGLTVLASPAGIASPMAAEPVARQRVAQVAGDAVSVPSANPGSDATAPAPGASPGTSLPATGSGVVMPGLPPPNARTSVPSPPTLPGLAPPVPAARVPVLASPQQAAPAVTPPVTPPTPTQATSQPPASPANKPTVAAPIQAPVPSGSSRNGLATLPTLAQPNQPGLTQPTRPAQPDAAVPNAVSPSITYGGPQIDVQPVYGSPLRDSGAGNNGVPVYNSVPGISGGPINGTANAYFETLPPGALLPGQTAPSTRTGQDQPGVTSATRQPLGGSPYSRDQFGTFGNRNGYNAQGVYSGTAAQNGGIGYGSPYAPSGRPTGGILSTGVDASGPLRPYIPLNGGQITQPNSGYGVPNGSRPSRMDANGIQRMN